MEMRLVDGQRVRLLVTSVCGGTALFVSLLTAFPANRLTAQDTTAVKVANDSVSVHFVETDLRAVIQALSGYLPKPVLVGQFQPLRVSLETPGLVTRGALVPLLKGLVESQNLEFVEDSAFYRVMVRPAAAQPTVSSSGGRDTALVLLFVIRLKHARASDVAATVNLLFGGGGEFSGASGLSSGPLSDELRRNVVPSAGAPGGAATPPAQPSRHSASLAGPVTIVPDELLSPASGDRQERWHGGRHEHGRRSRRPRRAAPTPRARAGRCDAPCGGE